MSAAVVVQAANRGSRNDEMLPLRSSNRRRSFAGSRTCWSKMEVSNACLEIVCWAFFGTDPNRSRKTMKNNYKAEQVIQRFESMTSETPKPDRAILKLTPRNNSASISVSIPASSSWISLGVASSKPISVGVATPCFTPDSEGRDQVSGSARSLFAMAALSKSATWKNKYLCSTWLTNLIVPRFRH